MCTKNDTPIGMTSEQAEDLRVFNRQIEATEMFLASVHDQRDRLLSRIEASPTLAGDHFSELRAVNAHLAEFQQTWDDQHRLIDDSFDQQLANQATEPQREFSDSF